jgi:hypothetical protein
LKVSSRWETEPVFKLEQTMALTVEPQKLVGGRVRESEAAHENKDTDNFLLSR